jgi:hypothetical protein
VARGQTVQRRRPRGGPHAVVRRRDSTKIVLRGTEAARRTAERSAARGPQATGDCFAGTRISAPPMRGTSIGTRSR